MSTVDADVLVVGAGAIGGVTAALMEGKVRRVMVLDVRGQVWSKLLINSFPANSTSRA